MRRALVALFRVRGIALYTAAVVLIVDVLPVPFGDAIMPREIRAPIVGTAIGVLGAVVILGLAGRRLLPTHGTRVVRPPVSGRWRALNSPASTVPSHGVRAYGQAYAIDLVAEPEGDDAPKRPEFGGEMFRRNEVYPAFGQPVHAMIDGTVVRSTGWRRDHRARSNTWALAYMMVEGAVRELGGPGFVVGNHVTIRGDDGEYALVAHLQRGSISVRRGERVTAGQPIARCGNSGNSSEPHVHAQLMDRRSLWTGQGLPMAFAGLCINGEPCADALPANDQHLTA